MPIVKELPAWSDYRRRRAARWFTILATLPVFSAGGAWIPEIPGKPLYVVLAWGGVAGAVGYWLSLFRCPACGSRFHGSGFWMNLFARRCQHCGLRACEDPPGGVTT